MTWQGRFNQGTSLVSPRSGVSLRARHPSKAYRGHVLAIQLALRTLLRLQNLRATMARGLMPRRPAKSGRHEGATARPRPVKNLEGAQELRRPTRPSTMGPKNA